MLGVAAREPVPAASLAAVSPAERLSAWLGGAARALALGTELGFPSDVLEKFRLDVCSVNTSASNAHSAIYTAEKKRLKKADDKKHRVTQAVAEQDKSAAVDGMSDVELEAVVAASLGVVRNEEDEQDDIAAVILEGVRALSSASVQVAATAATGAGVNVAVAVSSTSVPAPPPPPATSVSVFESHRWVSYTDTAGKQKQCASKCIIRLSFTYTCKFFAMP